MNLCRLCQNPITPFLDLGHVSLPEDFRTKAQLNEPIPTFQLGLSYCVSCFHVQLTTIVDQKTIYKDHYFYDFGVTKTGHKHWVQLAHKVQRLAQKQGERQMVVDIGSNTGAFLMECQKVGLPVLGVDPAVKQVAIARKNGVPSICDFFSETVAKAIVRKHGHAAVITCTNTFDHVAYLDSFMKGIQLLLAEKGTFIIEVPYFGLFVKNISHIVYHQQIDYMYVRPLVSFFAKYGMVIADCTVVPLHGGSLRLFIKKQPAKQSKRVDQLLAEEQIIFKRPENLMKDFAKNVIRQRDSLIQFVNDKRKRNQAVVGVGASAKGITLLNYAKLDKKDIGFVTEKSSLKIGTYTASGIPVVPDQNLAAHDGGIALLLAWNFSPEIMRNIAVYKKSGWRFYAPVPILCEL